MPRVQDLLVIVVVVVPDEPWSPLLHGLIWACDECVRQGRRFRKGRVWVQNQARGERGKVPA